jgi:hypothetical protein
MPRTVALVGFGVLFAVILVQFIVQLAGPTDDGQESGRGVKFPDQGRRHLAANETFEPYNSFPPSSGPHAAAGVAPGIYGPDQPSPFSETPDFASLLPILEQGGIVIYYDSAMLGPAAIDGLTSDVRILREGPIARPDTALPNIVLTPIDGENESGFALYATAWRHVLSLERADALALRRVRVGDVEQDALEVFVRGFHGFFDLENTLSQEALSVAE